MANIKVANLHKKFDDFVAVKESNFEINDGEFFVMLGPSGCGKTTTLRIIAGLEFATAGSVYLNESDITNLPASKRDIAFVFQLFALYPHMGVRGNIAFPLNSQGLKRSEINQRVNEALKILRIEHIANERLSKLSGGDRQRVALGRAIVRNPAAFLLDEPLGALDANMRQVMCEELRGLHDRLNATMVYVTHDQLEAMAMADRIMVMNHGIIEQIDTPQKIYDRPNSMYVADFIGSPPMAFLKASGQVGPNNEKITVAGSEINIPAIKEELNINELMIGVRPEHVQVISEGGVKAKVYESEYLGTTQMVTLNTAVGQIRMRSTAKVKFKSGDNIQVTLNEKQMVLFDNQTGKALENLHG